MPLDQIELSTQKWRSSTGDTRLEELATSLREQGQIHNVSLLASDNGTDKWETVNGQRRCSAARKNKFRTIRADIYRWERADGEDRDLAIARHLYAANMSEPLLPLERASMFAKIMDEAEFSIEQVADLFENETVESVGKVLQLLEIDEKALEVVINNPDRFSEATLSVLAEYSSPAKKAWRMQPVEQVRMAEEIVQQKDKAAINDTRKLDRNFKAVVTERRNREKVKRQQEETKKRKQTDPVKALFKAMEAAENAVNDYVSFETSAIKEIDAADKGYVLNRTYTLVERLSTFAEDELGKLPQRKPVAAA